MELKIIGEGEKEIWDNAVHSSPHGTIFHTWKWLKIVERHSFKQTFTGNYPSKLYPLAVFQDSKIIGLLPVFCYTLPFLKMVTSPAIAVENYYLGPVMGDVQDLKPETQQIMLMDFQSEIDNFIKNTLHPKFILVHTSPHFTDIRPYKWSGYEVEPRYTYEIDLTRGKDAIWENFGKNLKYYIRRTEKEGVTVEEGSRDDGKFIYELLKQRERIHPREDFLLEIFDNFSPGDLHVFIARQNNKNLTGIIILTYKNSVIFWLGAPKLSIRGIIPNELVIWKSIAWAIENGYERYEIMVADDLSLFPFKRKFNGTLLPFYTLRWRSPFFRLVDAVYHGIRPRYR